MQQGTQLKDEAELKRLAGQLAIAMGWAWFDGVGVNGAADKIYLKQNAGWVAEFKTKIGTQSTDQEDEQIRMAKLGIPYYLIRTLEEFRTAILTEERKLNDYT